MEEKNSEQEDRDDKMHQRPARGGEATVVGAVIGLGLGGSVSSAARGARAGRGVETFV